MGWRIWIIALSLTGLSLIGCGKSDHKTVAGDRSSTVFLISKAVAEEFRAVAPEVRVTVGVSGTGGGFKKLCAGETDFQDASRPLKASEVALARTAASSKSSCRWPTTGSRSS